LYFPKVLVVVAVPLELFDKGENFARAEKLFIV